MPWFKVLLKQYLDVLVRLSINSNFVFKDSFLKPLHQLKLNERNLKMKWMRTIDIYTDGCGDWNLWPHHLSYWA